MKKYLIGIPIVVIVVSLVTFLQNRTYSNYKKGVIVNISDTTGGLICDASLDNPGTYVSDDGWAYFIIKVKNYDSNDVISGVPVEYYLDITNSNTSNALYRYSTVGDNGSFTNSVTTNSFQFAANTKQNRDIIVEVKTNDQDAKNVDFNVNLYCYQTTK